MCFLYFRVLLQLDFSVVTKRFNLLYDPQRVRVFLSWFNALQICIWDWGRGSSSIKRGFPVIKLELLRTLALFYLRKSLLRRGWVLLIQVVLY